MNNNGKKKYFIQQYIQHEYSHGGVGCSDAEKIFLSKGFRPVIFPYDRNFSVKAKIARSYFLISTFLGIKKRSVVIFVFPFYARMEKLLARLLLIRRSVKVVCFIVDIDGIKDGNTRLVEKEISFFSKIKYFIVLNDNMRQWLDTNVPGNVSSKIDFHSFLTAPVDAGRKQSFHIVFAGNLEKSNFLHQLHLLEKPSPSLHFNLYGPGPVDELIKQKNVTYYGIEKPYDLPGKLQGSFGLLWDGDSIDGPDGNFGHYMKFISHHKLSLYILGKLPIIVAASAGSAPLIEKYRIGILVNSLYEIEDRIRNISPDEYRQMQINMQPLAEKISKGEFLSDAIDEIVKLV